MQAILSPQPSDDEIAIPVLGGVIGVFAIFALRVLDGQFWDGAVEVVELLEERTTEIEIPPIFERIVGIAPPCARINDDIRLVRRIYGDELLAGEVAFAMIELPLIPKGKPALQAAIRTQCRRRDQLLLPIENRRHLFIERKVVLGYFECRRTLFAGRHINKR